jgi:hypothetical protein
MVAPMPDNAHRNSLPPLEDSMSRGGSRLMWPRYQMLVLATDVADAVVNVSGLAVDLALQGWDVVAAVVSSSAMDLMRVVGARLSDFSSIFEAPDFAGAIAVAADLLNVRPDVQQFVTSAMRNVETELLVWGAPACAGTDVSFQLKAYEPSVAARAFKVHALRGLGIAPQPGAMHEVFACAELSTPGE